MYQFIVNPSAGSGRGFRVWKKLERQLEREGQEYRVFFTEREGDAAETAKILTSDKTETKILVVVGGEGTYNEVLNGISFRGMLTLGYVPAGHRNALSRGYQSFWKLNRQMKQILHPKYYEFMNYGVLTSGGDEIFNRRFAGRCGVGLDAAICHNLLCSPIGKHMRRFHMSRLLKLILGMKQLMLSKTAKGYIVLDGVKRVEFDHLYFITFHVNHFDKGRRNRSKKKNQAAPDNGKMQVYIANSSRKANLLPIITDVIRGVRKKERGVRVYECEEAAVHLEHPLAVHVDGESCMCQQDLVVRCIQKQIRVIGYKRRKEIL